MKEVHQVLKDQIKAHQEAINPKTNLAQAQSLKTMKRNMTVTLKSKTTSITLFSNLDAPGKMCKRFAMKPRNTISLQSVSHHSSWLKLKTT